MTGSCLKVAIEEPQIGVDIQLGDDFALAVSATGIVDPGNPVKHQHLVNRQAHVAFEQASLAAGDQRGFIVVLRKRHWHGPGVVKQPRL
jgi:hypothetical protein